MNIEIFYFSGTGNSLFIAKELIKQLPNSRLTPIVKALNEDNCTTNADIIGFVFPVHALSIPIIVKKFIEKINIESVQYTFAVATRGGTSFHGFKKIEKLLKKKSHTLDARFIINMVLNDARNKIFSIPNDETRIKMKNDELLNVEKIAMHVLKKEKVNEPDNMITIKSANSKIATVLLENIVLVGMSLAEKTHGVDYFYHNDNCNNCGICQRVCLSGKIKKENDKPVWQKDVFCNMCYACINYCPQQAIQIHDVPYVKSYTIVNGRYHHQNAKVSDIESQKT